jgi:segregation and condensation protein B
LELLDLHIEAILFASENPVVIDDLVTFVEKQTGLASSKESVEEILNRLMEKYQHGNFPFMIAESGGGYYFLTKPEYHETVVQYLHRNTVKRLTTAALETLSIIAYKQPVTKSMVESIRGVSCDYTIQKLMEKELVEIKGRSQEAGKPLLYGTTAYFLDYFGINALDEMPRLKEFHEPENQIGEKESILQTGSGQES